MSPRALSGALLALALAASLAPSRAEDAPAPGPSPDATPATPWTTLLARYAKERRASYTLEHDVNGEPFDTFLVEADLPSGARIVRSSGRLVNLLLIDGDTLWGITPTFPPGDPLAEEEKPPPDLMKGVPEGTALRHVKAALGARMKAGHGTTPHFFCDGDLVLKLMYGLAEEHLRIAPISWSTIEGGFRGETGSARWSFDIELKVGADGLLERWTEQTRPHSNGTQGLRHEYRVRGWKRPSEPLAPERYRFEPPAQGAGPKPPAKR